MASKHQVRKTKRDAKAERARRDELKRRQQAAERRRTVLTLLAGLVVGSVVIAAVVVARWNPTRVGYVSRPSAAAKKAGCTGVRNDGSAGRQARSAPIRYRSAPPSSGDFDPDPLPEQPAFVPRGNTVPRLTPRAVHNLARGFVVGWYDAALPAAEVTKLRSSATAANRFLAVPWTGRRLSDGRPFVLTAWQRTQRCRTVSVEVITAFATAYGNASRAPESGGPGGTAPATRSSTPPTAVPSPSRSPSPSPASPSPGSPSPRSGSPAPTSTRSGSPPR